MIVNAEQLERDLTAYFAGVLGLTVDSGIYRGQIPETVENGVSVRLTGQETGSTIDHAKFTVQVLGKFASRENAWVMLTKLAGELPQYGVATTNFVLVYLLPDGGMNAPFTNDERGRVRQYASFNLRVAVLTRAA